MKTKLKEKTTLIEFPVLRYIFCILVTNNIKESYLKRYRYEYTNRIEPKAMFVNETGDKSGTIYLNFDACPEAISHECYHGVRAMQRSFTNADIGNEEWEAYHLGYLVGKVHEFIEKGKRKRRASSK